MINTEKTAILHRVLLTVIVIAPMKSPGGTMAVLGLARSGL
jgi:hypothetical protein